MRSYELMVIIRADLDEEQTAAAVDKVTGLIAQNGGEVENIDRWGKRRLAYEINDLRDGYYILVNYKGPSQVARELDRVLKITDEVIRHLVVLRAAAV